MPHKNDEVMGLSRTKRAASIMSCSYCRKSIYKQAPPDIDKFIRLKGRKDLFTDKQGCRWTFSD